jgi:PAS domain S-box-containing protein
MKLLIVSTQSETKQFFLSVAEKENIQSVVVDEAKKALRALIDTHFNLVLLDWEVSNDSSKLLKNIRIGFSQTQLPVIVVCNSQSESIVANAIDMGANDFVLKPYNELMIRVKIRNLLELQINSERLIKTERSLKERIKELNCIEQFSNMIQNDDNIKVILKKLVFVLQESFRYPDYTGFKITYNDYAFKTSNFLSCVSVHTTAMMSTNKQVGSIEVGICGESELAILPEEITLLNVIAERLSKIIEQHEQHKKYQNLFDTLNEGIVRTNSKGEIIEANQAAAVVCGYPTPSDLIGNHIKVIYAQPEKRNDVLRKLKADGDALYNFEFLLKRQNGDIIWTLCNIRLLRNDKGGVTGTIGAFRDITDLKKSEEEILKARNRLVNQLNFTKSLVNNIPNPIFYKARDGRYLGCNEAFERFTGKKSSEIIGKTVFQLWETERAKVYHNKDIELMKQGGSQRYEFQVKNAQGELRDVVFLKSCFTDDQHKVTGIIGTYIDITDRIKAEHTIAENEEKYRKLYSFMNEGVCLHELVFNEKGDPVDYRIKDVNQKYEDILGLSKKDVVGKLASQVYPGNEPPYLEKFSRVAISGEPVDFETFFEGFQKYYKVSVFAPAKNQFATVFHDITQEKKARQEIAEREQRYRALFYNNYSVMLLIDPDTGAIIDANNAAIQYYGYSSEQIKKMNINQINILSKEDVYNEMQNAKKAKRNIFYFKHKLANEELRDVEVYSGKIILDSKTYLYSIIHDISDRKKAERALKKSEARYKRLINNTTSLIMEVNVDTYEIISCNPAMAKSLSKTVNELIGKKLSDLISPEIFEKRKEMGEKALKENKVLHFEDERDGRHFLNNLVPYISDKGRFVQTVAHDITNLKIKQALIDSEETLSLIIENMPFGVFAHKMDGKFNLVNNKAADYTGYSKNELLKMKVSDIDRDSVTRKDREQIWEKLIKGESVEIQSVHFRRDGSSYPVQINITAVRLKKVKTLLAIVQDITDRKKAEAELKQSEARYRELNATKDKFFSIISHDLRNPFSAILGLSDLAVKKIQNGEYDKIQMFSEAIHKTSRQAYNLLNNLLCWSRLQRGKIDFNPQKIEMYKVIQEVVGLLNANIREKSLNLSVKVADDLIIFADPDMLQTIIRNLLSNAIKFTPENGQISISSKSQGDATLIEVEDSGIGIPKEDLTKLFKIASNFSTSGTNDEKGTGLGLILCKDFVEKHNGKIWVESEPGKGTKFSFIL